MFTKKSPSASLILATTLFLLLVVAANACFPACSHPPNLPTPTTATPKGSCPRDALKLGVCAKLLNGSVGTVVGSPPDAPCCSVLGGLLDLEAAVCLCTALKANVLGINIDIPISLSLLVNTCGKELPSDFICA